MDGVEAGFHFAGIVGIRPAGQTLKRLWMMANGRVSQRRRELLELANLVWGLDSVDHEAYLLYGEFAETGKGKAVQVRPDLQEKIDAEIERIRRENPGLPKLKTHNG